MKASHAKSIVEDVLNRLNLPFEKLTAKTNSLGLFVTVHGWQPNPLWDEVKKVGKLNGFIVMTQGDVF